jgi:hypothetical protein
VHGLLQRRCLDIPAGGQPLEGVAVAEYASADPGQGDARMSGVDRRDGLEHLQ